MEDHERIRQLELELELLRRQQEKEHDKSNREYEKAREESRHNLRFARVKELIVAVVLSSCLTMNLMPHTPDRVHQIEHYAEHDEKLTDGIIRLQIQEATELRKMDSIENEVGTLQKLLPAALHLLPAVIP